MELNFAKKFVIIKSNWFDENGKISSIGIDAFFLFLCMYKYYIPNQSVDYFNLSIHNLKTDTGFTEKETIRLFKLLMHHKIIECSIKRWDRYQIKNTILIKFIDQPLTKREERENKMVDIPIDEENYYIMIDMLLMQEYINLNLSKLCFSLYSLFCKYSNGIEQKCNLSIDTISNRLNVTNYRVQKCIYEMNRERLMYSRYIKLKGNLKQYKFEHYLFKRLDNLNEMRVKYEKQIYLNVKKWNKNKLQVIVN